MALSRGVEAGSCSLMKSLEERHIVRVPARDVVPHVPGFDIDRILGPGYMLEITTSTLKSDEIGEDKDKVNCITEMTFQGVITTEFDVIRASRSHRWSFSRTASWHNNRWGHQNVNASIFRPHQKQLLGLRNLLYGECGLA